MLTFIIRRLMMLPITLIGVTIFVILLTQLLSPTQRAAAYVKSEAQLKNIEKVIEQYGIDKPWYVQYGNWLKQAVQGNFGFSKSTGEPVLTAFWRRFPNTVELAILVIIPTLLTAFGIATKFSFNVSSELANAVISPPTFKAPLIPTPPVTTTAPTVLLEDAVEFVSTTLLSKFTTSPDGTSWI